MPILAKISTSLLASSNEYKEFASDYHNLIDCEKCQWESQESIIIKKMKHHIQELKDEHHQEDKTEFFNFCERICDNFKIVERRMLLL